MCGACTNILDKPWAPDVAHGKITQYKPIVDGTYWCVLVSFNNWSDIQFTNKNTPSEEFDDSNKVVLDGTSVNVVSLVQTGKYGAINEADTTTIGYYVVN